MFKKILLTSLLLFTFFGSISLGDCTPPERYQSLIGGNEYWCTTYRIGSYKEARYCNQSNAFSLFLANYIKNYPNITISNQDTEKQIKEFNTYLKATKQTRTFDYEWKTICKLQEILGGKADGKLWNETISSFLQENRCAKIPRTANGDRTSCQQGCCEAQVTPPVLDAENTQPQEDTKTPPKCWEHAYTCASGENPSDQKYNEKEKTCTRKCGETLCPEDGKAVKCSTYSEAEQQLWIGLNKDCLVHGGCSLDVYKTLWIRQNSKKETRTSVLSFFQDIIGASTFFIGTILTIAFVISGFRYVLAGASGNDPQNAKNGMKYSIIGFVLVMSAYAIIRFVQYLASTGG